MDFSKQELSGYTNKLLQLNSWLISVPLTKEYRERTTFRQFYEEYDAKKQDLGLTSEIFEQLYKHEGNDDLEMALLEVGMTMDNRELMAPTYFIDLPLNYFMMPQYDALAAAVDRYIASQPMWKGIPDEDIYEAIKHLLPDGPNGHGAE